MLCIDPRGVEDAAPTNSDQRALQPLIQLDRQHGGQNDLHGIAGQVGSTHQPRALTRSAPVSVMNQIVPSR